MQLRTELLGTTTNPGQTNVGHDKPRTATNPGQTNVGHDKPKTRLTPDSDQPRTGDKPRTGDIYFINT